MEQRHCTGSGGECQQQLLFPGHLLLTLSTTEPAAICEHRRFLYHLAFSGRWVRGCRVLMALPLLLDNLSVKSCVKRITTSPIFAPVTQAARRDNLFSGTLCCMFLQSTLIVDSQMFWLVSRLRRDALTATGQLMQRCDCFTDMVVSLFLFTPCQGYFIAHLFIMSGCWLYGWSVFTYLEVMTIVIIIIFMLFSLVFFLFYCILFFILYSVLTRESDPDLTVASWLPDF